MNARKYNNKQTGQLPTNLPNDNNKKIETASGYVWVWQIWLGQKVKKLSGDPSDFALFIYSYLHQSDCSLHTIRTLQKIPRFYQWDFQGIIVILSLKIQ